MRMTKLKNILKVVTFLLLVSIFVNINLLAYKTLRWGRNSLGKGEIMVLQTPLKTVYWEQIGKVSEPIINLSVKILKGYKKITFLIDSGAVISTLPETMASEMGLDLGLLQRTPFVGFGGTEVFAYKGEMTVLLGDTEVKIPVIFAQGSEIKSLLGRLGFIDEYVVTFDNKRGIVEIKK